MELDDVFAFQAKPQCTQKVQEIILSVAFILKLSKITFFCLVFEPPFTPKPLSQRQCQINGIHKTRKFY